MNAKLEKIKTHFRENKKIYITGVSCLIVGAASAYFISNRSGSGILAVQKINQIGFRNEANPVIVNLIELSTPSKPVHLVGSEKYFNSIHDAARKTGHQASMISKNVNGHIPDVKGDMFEFLEKAS
jgi:hypothetical protein